MKLTFMTAILSGFVVTSVVSGVRAGGLPEPTLEPYVQTPGDGAEVVRPVRPAARRDVTARVRCVFVPETVSVTPEQTFVNQGLYVAGCCCGGVSIPGNSFTQPVTTSVKQKLVCGVGGES